MLMCPFHAMGTIRISFEVKGETNVCVTMVFRSMLALKILPSSAIFQLVASSEYLTKNSVTHWSTSPLPWMDIFVQDFWLSKQSWNHWLRSLEPAHHAEDIPGPPCVEFNCAFSALWLEFHEDDTTGRAPVNIAGTFNSVLS